MEIHTNGNTTAGGVHDGRFFCFFASLSFAIFGLDAFNGLNTRLRNANMKNITATIAFAAPKLLACNDPNKYFCATAMTHPMAPTSTHVAPTYFATLTPSNVPVLTLHASIQSCVSSTRARIATSFSLTDMYAFPGPSLNDTAPALARVVVVVTPFFERIVRFVIILIALLSRVVRRASIVVVVVVNETDARESSRAIILCYFRVRFPRVSA
jgi:hypothetical protein